MGAALAGATLATSGLAGSAALVGAALVVTGLAGWVCLLARYFGLSPFQLALSLRNLARASASVMTLASAVVGNWMREPTRMWLMLPSAKLRGFFS